MSAISGFGQAVEACAFCTSAAATASMPAGSAGALGVPTRFGRFISQYAVEAPASRSALATGTPVEATVTPGRPKTAWRNATEPSENSTGSGPVGVEHRAGGIGEGRWHGQRENSGNERRRG